MVQESGPPLMVSQKRDSESFGKKFFISLFLAARGLAADDWGFVVESLGVGETCGRRVGTSKQVARQ